MVSDKDGQNYSEKLDRQTERQKVVRMKFQKHHKFWYYSVTIPALSLFLFKTLLNTDSLCLNWLISYLNIKELGMKPEYL